MLIGIGAFGGLRFEQGGDCIPTKSIGFMLTQHHYGFISIALRIKNA
jgi:hypothetical protein